MLYQIFFSFFWRRITRCSVALRFPAYPVHTSPANISTPLNRRITVHPDLLQRRSSWKISLLKRRVDTRAYLRPPFFASFNNQFHQQDKYRRVARLQIPRPSISKPFAVPSPPCFTLTKVTADCVGGSRSQREAEGVSRLTVMAVEDF